MKYERMETQLMEMDAIITVQLSNTLILELEVLKQAKIHALDVSKESIKTTQLTQNSVLQDVEMDTEWMMKSVMMVTTTMVMGVHQIVMLKKGTIVLVEAQLFKIHALCVRLCLSQAQIKLSV